MAQNSLERSHRLETQHQHQHPPTSQRLIRFSTKVNEFAATGASTMSLVCKTACRYWRELVGGIIYCLQPDLPLSPFSLSLYPLLLSFQLIASMLYNTCTPTPTPTQKTKKKTIETRAVYLSISFLPTIVDDNRRRNSKKKQ